MSHSSSIEFLNKCLANNCNIALNITDYITPDITGYIGLDIRGYIKLDITRYISVDDVKLRGWSWGFKFN